jgi:hypothetical protein
MRCAIVVAISLAFICRFAQAATGTVMTRAGNGFSLTLSTQWLDGGGYRPLEVTLVPTAPPKADQTIHIEFHAHQYFYPSTREIAVSQDIDVPAGSTQVVETMAVPQIFSLQNCKLEVWLNGRYSSKLSIASFFGGSGLAIEGLPAILVVVAPTTGTTVTGTTMLTADPDSSVLASIFPAELNQQQQYWGAPTPPAGTTKATPLQSLITVPSNQLPRRWIELSSLDIICISLGELKRLATGEPDRLKALQDWTLAGGNLIVFDAGAKLEQVDNLSKLFIGTSDDGGPVSDWSRPKEKDFRDRLNSTYTAYGVQSPTVTTVTMPQDAPFLLRRMGSGMIIAAATDDLFQQPAQYWIWMLNSLGSDRWLWCRRHGLSLDRKNADFWTWLVRGVGLAPVTEFRVLITVFVLAIGPLNYFWLRRRGKLHLLVVLVPLAALTVTSALFGYAIVADGLDVRVRARTFTQIDQRTRHAVCWSRISYYAGMAPSGGLVFPDDVVAIPLTANDGDASDMPPRQDLVWSRDKQELVSGWLASRTPAQYMTVRSRQSEAGLRFVQAQGQAGPQIENRLGTRVIHLLVADDDGKHYRAADVAAGSLAPLEAVEAGQERSAIDDFVAKHQPALQEGFVPPSASTFSGRRRNFYSTSNNSLPATSIATGRLEASLREVASAPGARSSKAGEASLAPRTYLAIVERSPEVVFGVDDPREEDSLHVVVGRW